MEITYLGHSSFKLRGRSATVVTDPFDPKMVGLKYPQVEAEIVTLSHDHNDHNQAGLVKGVKKVISGPGEYEIAGVSILGFGSFHDGKNGELRGKNTIYVIEMDGVRLCHLGDLGHGLSEEKIAQLGDIDILFVPVGGEFTIGPKEAVAIVSGIEPYFVIPMHFQTPGLNPAGFAKLQPVESFLSECGLTVEKMPKLAVKKEEIIEDQSTKVIVLEKK
jgi:L-ascorbate metabolism protein UlaG (beta-lactamase superfamily)